MCFPPPFLVRVVSVGKKGQGRAGGCRGDNTFLL